MDDHVALAVTKTRLALLADVAAEKVADDEDGTVWLDRGDGERAKVSAAIWELERAGWVHQPEGASGWRLTDTGQDVMQGRGAHG